MKLNSETTTNTFAILFYGAKIILEDGRKAKEGQLYYNISCLILLAFSLEAYFNHLGTLLFSDWDKTEKSKPKREKFKFFCTELKIKCDYRIKPYRTVFEVFKFRDLMAHGKTSVDKEYREIKEFASNLEFAKPDWHMFASEYKNVFECLENISLIIKKLNIAAGYDDDPFNPLSSSTAFLKPEKSS
ncbi:MAG: hypothetical protein KDD94_09015 [Calditrichaeota bacterium]|nr:hypothetical protein [Calditrichota bacterium]